MEEGVYFALGLAASIYGTIIGAGGGFIATPVLLLFGLPKEVAAQASLFLVLASSLFGSLTYARKRIGQLRTSAIHTSPSLMGGLIGPLLHRYVSGGVYNLIFAGLLASIGAYLLIRNLRNGSAGGSRSRSRTSWWVVAALSFPFSVLGSLFGFGGGLLMTPMLVLMGLDPHVAASIALTLAVFTSSAGLVSYSSINLLSPSTVIPLLLGGILGGQIGPRIAIRFGKGWVVRLLSAGTFALALMLVLEVV